ncbi:MAG: hypothetical protein V1867_07435 [Candidatus Falkowbacteria bacterium]
MKKILFTFVFALAFLPLAASAGQLPNTTWQVYGGDILTVYSGSYSNTSIVYQGDPQLYTGTATNRMPATNSSTVSPAIKTNWQVYGAGTLTVYSGNNDKTPIIYSGAPEGYVEMR